MASEIAAVGDRQQRPVAGSRTVERVRQHLVAVVGSAG